MDSVRVTHLPFDPYESYAGAYRTHFYRSVADSLRGRVLDVGAGGNELATTYEEDVPEGGEYLAVDVDPAPGIDVVGDGEALPFADDCFDAVVLSAVLEHLRPTTVPRVVEEAYRVLRPGGRALASVPFVEPLHVEPDDYARYTPYGLADVFDAAEFETVAVYAGGSYVETLLQALYRPFRTITHHFGVGWLAWAFALIHYPAILAASGSDALLRRAYGRNMLARPWYLETSIVAEK